MAEKGAEEPAKRALTAAEKQLLRRRQELDNWKKNAARLRNRNLLTGLGIGAFVVGMCILQGPEAVTHTHERCPSYTQGTKENTVNHQVFLCLVKSNNSKQLN